MMFDQVEAEKSAKISTTINTAPLELSVISLVHIYKAKSKSKLK